MQYYTMQDYVDLVVFLNRNVKRLNEEKEKYSAKEKIDNSSKHHKHDKLFREILSKFLLGDGAHLSFFVK